MLRTGKNDEIFRMLRTGARFSLKFSGCSARDGDFLQNFQDAPHGKAVFFKISRTLRTGARFSSKFSGCSAQERDFQNFRTLRKERDFLQTFQDARHGSAIFLKQDNLERSILV